MSCDPSMAQNNSGWSPNDLRVGSLNHKATEACSEEMKGTVKSF